MSLRSDVSGSEAGGVISEFSLTDAKLVVGIDSSAIENDSEDPQAAMRPASITVASATLDARATVTPSLSQMRWPITRRDHQQSPWDRSVYPNWRAHRHQLLVPEPIHRPPSKRFNSSQQYWAPHLMTADHHQYRLQGRRSQDESVVGKANQVTTVQPTL